MSDDKPAAAFISLKSVTQGAPDPAAALAQIRQIYFKTSRRTIDNDFAHAIELLKSLPDEDARQKAHVYMEGLAEMRSEWSKPAAVKKGGKKTGSAKAGKKGTKGKPAKSGKP